MVNIINGEFSFIFKEVSYILNSIIIYNEESTKQKLRKIYKWKIIRDDKKLSRGQKIINNNNFNMNRNNKNIMKIKLLLIIIFIINNNFKYIVINK